MKQTSDRKVVGAVCTALLAELQTNTILQSQRDPLAIVSMALGAALFVFGVFGGRGEGRGCLIVLLAGLIGIGVPVWLSDQEADLFLSNASSTPVIVEVQGFDKYEIPPHTTLKRTLRLSIFGAKKRELLLRAGDKRAATEDLRFPAKPRHAYLYNIGMENAYYRMEGSYR